MKRSCLLALCVFSLLSPAVGQEPIFRSRADLVQVPVVVTRGNLPLVGLKPEDFVLFCDGKPEGVTVFEEFTAVSTKVRPRLPAPSTVQNYSRDSSAQDVVILVLDFLNGSWSTAARMRQYLGSMSKLLAEKRTPVTLLLLSSKGLVQVHSFSTDTAQLVKAVEKWSSQSKLRATNENPSSPDPATEVSVSGKGEVLKDMTATQGVVERKVTDDRHGLLALLQNARVPSHLERRTLDEAEMTLQALLQVAQSFQGVPGRKKLVWMSPGFLGTEEASVQTSTAFGIASMREVALRALNTSNIVVYAVDSNGIVNATWEERFSPAHGGAGTPRPESTEVASDTSSLLVAAQQTGGLTCTDTPDVCMGKVQADAGHYYMLGFYLGDKKPGWHRLKVEVRLPGVSLRSRAGFFVGTSADVKAGPGLAARVSLPAVRKQANGPSALISALASPLDYTGLPLQLRWTESARSGGKHRIQLVLFSPPGGVATNTANALDLDYLAFAKPLGKAEGMSFPGSLVKQLSRRQLHNLEAGFIYRQTVSLEPGRYELRVLLRDNVSKKIGTVSTVLNVGAEARKK